VTRPVKRRLDRRYALVQKTTASQRKVRTRVKALERTVTSLADRVAALEDLVGRFDAVIDRHEQALETYREQLSGVLALSRVGAAFVSDEDPHELRKKLFAASRVAGESARAIETLLQAEVLLWQAIDAQSGERPR
jgi:predicted RNase H-like nuclease (RuvC/YqgF family)